MFSKLNQIGNQCTNLLWIIKMTQSDKILMTIIIIHWNIQLKGSMTKFKSIHD